MQSFCFVLFAYRLCSWCSRSTNQDYLTWPTWMKARFSLLFLGGGLTEDQTDLRQTSYLTSDFLKTCSEANLAREKSAVTLLFHFLSSSYLLPLSLSSATNVTWLFVLITGCCKPHQLLLLIQAARGRRVTFITSYRLPTEQLSKFQRLLWFYAFLTQVCEGLCDIRSHGKTDRSEKHCEEEFELGGQQKRPGRQAEDMERLYTQKNKPNI